MQKRGRKRLDPRVRLRVVQLRASNPEHPLSIDKIIVRLSREGGPVPARGSVQTIIKEWEDLPEEIRYRELPFEWHHLERARIPWEASRWVLECQAHHEQARIGYAGALWVRGATREHIDKAVDSTGRFTNRWATWSWRVHLARPDWETGRVWAAAGLYTCAEQARDLLPDHPDLFPSGLQPIMAHMPDLWAEKPQWGADYVDGLDFGILEPPPNLDQLDSLHRTFLQIPNLGELEATGTAGRSAALWVWINSWLTPLREYLDSWDDETQQEESEDARATEAKV